MCAWILYFDTMRILTGTTYKLLNIRLKAILFFAFQFEFESDNYNSHIIFKSKSRQKMIICFLIAEVFLNLQSAGSVIVYTSI